MITKTRPAYIEVPDGRYRSCLQKIVINASGMKSGYLGLQKQG